ncbi:hypothetical protein EX30DRAFT_397042 [Ascodesmis nigricans]|uniref:Uncharacterized protein n=1 Tax=Ascodesmis nigricans TaxID=341454 RepID=A0A4S2MQS3_9PEZI|nr:hypothetical protein EX30DRAFT_397042 [Ascodesmis nigricans]
MHFTTVLLATAAAIGSVTASSAGAYTVHQVKALTGDHRIDAKDCCHPFLGGCPNIPIIPCCGDGTPPTPYCGYGQCNIFGCNCDGGCRHR